MAEDVLQVENVAKRFGPVTALRDVNLHLGKGEVLGLLGDNGAGKSTLIKIISGFQKPDEGRLLLRGEETELKSVDHARSLGIDCVYQDLALVNELSVTSNMFLRREQVHKPFPILKRRAMARDTRKALDQIGINLPRIDVPVARLSGGQRQAIAVARTVTSDADIILLDEPLAAMGAKEGAMILDLVARLRAEGRVSIIMIAHNYVHVLEACDRVNLIQDGEITFDKPTADTSVEELNEIVVEEYRRARIGGRRQGRPGRAMSAHAAGARVPPTGSQFLLEGQGQRAVVTEVGATLRSWRVGEREQLDTFPVDELDDDYRGKVLVPWPNRIRDARYVFRGTEYRTAISEPERGGALHGLVLWASWRPLRHSRDEVALGYMLHPQPGYPFTLELEVAYRLVAGGLEVTLSATNRGAEPAPFGAGFHPYLKLGDALLRVPARSRIPVDERLLPTGGAVPVAGTEYDFRRPRQVGSRALDACFGDLERDADGLARASLVAGDGEVSVWMDEHFHFVHVFTEGGGIALEPMTCAPDAFNSGDGLLALLPGGSFAGRWGLNTHREVQ